MKGLGEAMMITLAGFGLKIENQIETPEKFEVYISVPEHSFVRNADQEEMAGMILAKRYKQVMRSIGMSQLVVKSRVRHGEYWTKDMANEAETNMKTMLYGY